MTDRQVELHERVAMPEALLPRTDRGALGLPRRGVDAVFRALDIVVLPGYAQPMVRVCDDVEPVEQSTYRKIVSGLGASSGSRGNPVRAATSNTSCRGLRCLSPAAEAEVTVDTGLLGRLGVRGGRCGLTALPRVPCPPPDPHFASIETRRGFGRPTVLRWVLASPSTGCGGDRQALPGRGGSALRPARAPPPQDLGAALRRRLPGGHRQPGRPRSKVVTADRYSHALVDYREIDRVKSARTCTGGAYPPCGRPRWKTPVLQGVLWAAHAGRPGRRDLLGVRGVRAGRDGVARRAQGSLPGS